MLCGYSEIRIMKSKSRRFYGHRLIEGGSSVFESPECERMKHRR